VLKIVADESISVLETHHFMTAKEGISLVPITIVLLFSPMPGQATCGARAWVLDLSTMICCFCVPYC